MHSSDTDANRGIQDSDELLFTIFCVENVARRLGIPGGDAYRLLDARGIIGGYIVPFYDVLHTQGSEYVTNDLLRLVERGDVIA